MKKLLFLLLIVSSKAIAQTPNLQFKNTIEVEVDPIAYILNGYSFHAIYNHNHFRYDAGFFGIEEPGSLSGNKDFKTFTSGFGVKANYMLKKVNGIYLGADLGYLKSTITEKESAEKDFSRYVSLGTHVGYRLFLFPEKARALNGLYLSPWAGLSYSYNYAKVNFAQYSEKPVEWFATLHIGYRL